MVTVRKKLKTCQPEFVGSSLTCFLAFSYLVKVKKLITMVMPILLQISSETGFQSVTYLHY